MSAPKPSTDEPTPQQQLVRDLVDVFNLLERAVVETRRLASVATGLDDHTTPQDDPEESQYEALTRHLEELVSELQHEIFELPEPRRSTT